MRVWMLVLGAGLLGGCLKSTKGFGVPQANSLAPSPNVFLRNSFDTDPSTYLGRFIPEGLEALDESAGMSLACSEHISWRYVEGGGVKYTEFLQASSEASARLGVPVFASAKGKGSSNPHNLYPILMPCSRPFSLRLRQPITMLKGKRKGKGRTHLIPLPICWHR